MNLKPTEDFDSLLVEFRYVSFLNRKRNQYPVRPIWVNRALPQPADGWRAVVADVASVNALYAIMSRHDGKSIRIFFVLHGVCKRGLGAESERTGYFVVGLLGRVAVRGVQLARLLVG